MRRQVAIRGTGMMPTKLPDLKLLEGVVAPRILDAMRSAAERLAKLRIRFALAGGLAVGAHGHPRATKDVGFLVGDEAFLHHEGGLVSIAPGVPIAVGDVAVDPISIEPADAHLNNPLNAAIDTGGIPVLPLEALVFMKLKSPRLEDAADIVELLRVRDATGVRAYLGANAPALLTRFEELVAKAAEDDE